MINIFDLSQNCGHLHTIFICLKVLRKFCQNHVSNVLTSFLSEKQTDMETAVLLAFNNSHYKLEVRNLRACRGLIKHNKCQGDHKTSDKMLLKCA